MDNALKDVRPVFMTGLARGGTNLTSRTLMAHPACEMAIHAFLPIFRSWRRCIVEKSGDQTLINLLMDDPAFHDGYFDTDARRLLDVLQDGTLDIDLPDADGKNLLFEQISSRASDECPDLVPHLSGLHGAKTYQQLLQEVLLLIQRERGGGHASVAGLVDNWIIDAFPALARSFPEALFIVVLRDPRGIVASNEKSQDAGENGHPFSFARQWRKYATMVQQFMQSDAFAGRICLVRYEDLVRQPTETVDRLCAFLGFEVHPAMLDPDQFVDPKTGQAWGGNSSYTDPVKGYDHSRLERWRKMDPLLKRVVDFMCAPEMAFLDYKTEFDKNELMRISELLGYWIERNDESYVWRSDTGQPLVDFGGELMRHALLGMAEPGADEALARQSFLTVDMYRRLHEQCAAGSPQLQSAARG